VKLRRDRHDFILFRFSRFSHEFQTGFWEGVLLPAACFYERRHPSKVWGGISSSADAECFTLDQFATRLVTFHGAPNRVSRLARCRSSCVRNPFYLSLELRYSISVGLNRFNETIKSSVRIMVPGIGEGCRELRCRMPNKIKILFIC
jgi:hypothetical protein